ncbi:conserved hypothetical protein [Burkholderia pseudomallei 668]|nr:conserved hypothetical protein [Burkholderia pseudomallei 668]
MRCAPRPASRARRVRRHPCTDAETRDAPECADSRGPRARPGIEMRRRSATPESVSQHRRRTRPDHAMTLEQASPRRHPTRESPNDGAT